MLKVNSIKVFNQLENCGDINLIIGPNNSGKTVFIKEIAASIDNIEVNSSNKWIREVRLNSGDMINIIKKIEPEIFNVKNFDMIKNSIKIKQKITTSRSLDWNLDVFRKIRQIEKDPPEFFNITENKYGGRDDSWPLWRFLTSIILSTEYCDTRLGENFETNIDTLEKEIGSDIIRYLFVTPSELRKIQNNLRTVFNINIGFDNLQKGLKQLRIMPKEKVIGSTRLPETENKWKKQSPLISDQGDGIKAYLKIVFTLLQLNKSIIIIDEPENFLHPPQRRALGKMIASENDKQVFIATHDPEFLRGILSSESTKLKIFYLRKDEDKFTYRTFETKDISELQVEEDSRIVTERVLNSFFYKSTILCEYEDDRLFYEHASALYCLDLYRETNFIGLSGRGGVRKLFENLMPLGLKIKIIVDVDFLVDDIFPECIKDKDAKQKFEKFKSKFIQLKGNNHISRKDFKKSGVNYLKIKHSNLIKDFYDSINGLKKHLIYVVPIGEFESFTGSKHRDLSNTLQVMHNTKNQVLANFLVEVLKS